MLTREIGRKFGSDVVIFADRISFDKDILAEIACLGSNKYVYCRLVGWV